jgi:hypothetical protein
VTFPRQKWARRREMRHEGHAVHSARLCASTATAKRIKRSGWQEQDILVVSVDDHWLILPQRLLVEKLGTELR